MGQKLVIAIDIRELKVAKTGTKTYLTEFCKAFKELENQDVQFIFLDTPFSVYTGENKLGKLFTHFAYHFWKQVVLPIKAWLAKADVLFCTDSYVPYIKLGYQTFPVFHDAFLFENPEHYNPTWLRFYLKVTVSGAKRAYKIICPSNYSKERIQHFTGFSNHQMLTVYEGPKSFVETDEQISKKFLQQFKLNKKEYLLHVGVMDKRKNLPNLVKSFAIIHKKFPELKLVLAGNTASKKHSNDYADILKEVKNAKLEDAIVFTGYLKDDELASLYSNALVYVFPSVNEGFGIPVLEAFFHKLPVAVANNSCLPEIGGEAVVTFNPYSPADIATQILSILNNPSLQKEMILLGKKRLSNFSWNKSAQQLIDVFKASQEK
ncbi:MAG: glycosyltransferase family 4 protein [Sphingobacteriales bacterium]|nr:glycosyltransferase family 4 protein [Sphingobacteriales bacterium]